MNNFDLLSIFEQNEVIRALIRKKKLVVLGSTEPNVELREWLIENGCDVCCFVNKSIDELTDDERSQFQKFVEAKFKIVIFYTDESFKKSKFYYSDPWTSRSGTRDQEQCKFHDLISPDLHGLLPAHIGLICCPNAEKEFLQPDVKKEYHFENDCALESIGMVHGTYRWTHNDICNC